MHQKASFTLVELLIVIGILAILTASIVLIINPAQRLKEARDSTRIQELSALEHTISILLTQQDRLFIGTSTYVYTSLPDSSSTCGSLGLPALPPGYTYQCVSEANLRNIDGTGWIPIDFSNTITQIPALPLDPINTTSSGLYYTYMMGGSFELTAAMESASYGLGGSHDAVSVDGGSYTGLLEKGTSKTLIPLDYGDTSLVGYWTFDEGSGASAYDYSGKGNEVSIIDAVWADDGLQFNGSTTYAPLPDNILPSKFTVVINGSTSSLDVGAHNYFLAGGNTIFAIERLGSELQFFYRSGSYKSKTFASSISTNIFYEMAVTYDGLGFKMYTNGALKDESQEVIDIPTTMIKFGKDLNGDRYLEGIIKDARIYNRVLSAAEIQAIYNATK